MQKLTEVCAQAMAGALAKHKQSVQAWEDIAGKSLQHPEWQPKVLTFAQLWEQAYAAHGEELSNNIETLLRSCRKVM